MIFLLTILVTCFNLGFKVTDQLLRPPCSLCMPSQIKCDTNVPSLVILEPSFVRCQQDKALRSSFCRR